MWVTVHVPCSGCADSLLWINITCQEHDVIVTLAGSRNGNLATLTDISPVLHIHRLLTTSWNTSNFIFITISWQSTWFLLCYNLPLPPVPSDHKQRHALWLTGIMAELRYFVSNLLHGYRITSDPWVHLPKNTCNCSSWDQSTCWVRFSGWFPATSCGQVEEMWHDSVVRATVQ